MRFELETDSRARAAGQDLRVALKERGIEKSLAECRNIVARMLGYDDWQDVRANVGRNGCSQDDSQVSDADRQARLAQQEQALLGAGLSAADARLVAELLRVTARDEPAAPPLTNYLRDPTDYHPNRLLDIMESIALEQSERREDGRGDLQATTDLEAGLVRSDEPAKDPVDLKLEDYALVAHRWAERVEITPMDEVHFVGNRGLDLALATERLGQRGGVIVDVSPIIEQVTTDTQPDVSFLDDKTLTTYVHFGRDHFPSPFEGRGVEGAYLQSTTTGDVVIDLIVSCEPGVQSLKAEDIFIQCCRSLRVGIAQDGISCDPQDNLLLNIWYDYLARPIATAIEAVRRYLGGDVAVVCSVPEHVAVGNMAAAYSRARTESMRAHLRAKWFEDQRFIVVEGCNGHPDTTSDEEAVTLPGPVSPQEATQHVLALLRMALAMNNEFSAPMLTRARFIAETAYKAGMATTGLTRRLSQLRRAIEDIATAEVAFPMREDADDGLALVGLLADLDRTYEPVAIAWRAYAALSRRAQNPMAVEPAINRLQELILHRQRAGLWPDLFQTSLFAVDAFLHWKDRDQAEEIFNETFASYPLFIEALDIGWYDTIDFRGVDPREAKKQEFIAEIVSRLLDPHELREFLDQCQFSISIGPDPEMFEGREARTGDPNTVN